MQIPAVVMELTELLPHVVDQFGAALSGCCHQIEKQEVDKNPIAFRQMSRQTDSTALFTTNQNLVLKHQFADIFESDRAFEQLQTQPFRDARDQQALRIGPGHCTAPTLVAIDVKQ